VLGIILGVLVVVLVLLAGTLGSLEGDGDRERCTAGVLDHVMLVERRSFGVCIGGTVAFIVVLIVLFGVVVVVKDAVLPVDCTTDRGFECLGYEAETIVGWPTPTPRIRGASSATMGPTTEKRRRQKKKARKREEEERRPISPSYCPLYCLILCLSSLYPTHLPAISPVSHV
jgi:hypothetical protein